MGEYPGVDDKWLNVISSQGSSLLSVDLSGSEVSDDGVTLLKDCTDLQSLNFNYCDRISDLGVQLLSGKPWQCFLLSRCLFSISMLIILVL